MEEMHSHIIQAMHQGKYVALAYYTLNFIR